MTPLVSVLIPSRKRVANLIRCLESLRDSATSNRYETLIRIDDDDQSSINAANFIRTEFLAKVFIGPRLGYSELDSGYYAGLERDAVGTWSFICGDDTVVSGDWLGGLSNVPTKGFIVQPEISKLGGSTYLKAEAQAFPIFPRLCWKKYTEHFPKPFDTEGHALLVRNGWKTWFLPGVTFWHDEATPTELAKHRQ